MTQTVYKIYKSEKFPGSKEYPWIVGRYIKHPSPSGKRLHYVIGIYSTYREAASQTAVLVNIRKSTKGA